MNLNKFAEIMKKIGSFAGFILESIPKLFLIPNFFKIMLIGTFEGKEMWFLRIVHDTAIRNGQVHHMSMKIKIYGIYF